ncbi:uncharacterized protein K452DRAFT_268557 [Aplosporella prunicola CBS 121167]|uniref:FAD dependent oxidoreductase domain-containing protein n=1 Tax=Aplosporella prunicola CBS 121167 TaxID=1176127 RepID=A0A6A6BGB3_9PEZI|nr:uncharacterized protein K452DRAFT_268557 [Aplosporella prunicola CBS 121167]KAF2143210.1 hypothetical protein K452DRAFT_268557 [Aplosporella prunicola CBS 121167]
MAKITILGAGITGLAIAHELTSRGHAVTIIARDLPTPRMDLAHATQGWASPWAGACFLGLDGATPHEQGMQREAFHTLWTLAETNPESSVRRIEMHDLQDTTPLEQIWYRDLMPEFRVMAPAELPSGCRLGMAYMSVVLNPVVFLPWLRKKLEKAGVRFVKREVGSLEELKGQGHNVLVNATGWGAKFLGGVVDAAVQQIRGQTLLVKTSYGKIFMRHGKDYTYCIPRLDGTAVLGGIKQVGNTDPRVDENLKMDICNRVSANLPYIFSTFPADFELVRDNVGIRPGREGGVRVEKDVIDSQKVVHAYADMIGPGVGGGGYCFSFGVGKVVGDLVGEILSASPQVKL